MSLFKIPSPKPKLARNGFDLSSRRIFSAKAGQLLPVGCWECNPSEHFQISVQDIVRTTNLNTAAFARMKEYYHFFFVSYKSLWQWFDQFIVGTSNPVSALNGIKKNHTVDYNYVCSSTPMFDLNTFVTHLKSDTMKNTFDSQAFPFKDGAFKLLNLLNYGVTEKGKFYDYKSYFSNSNNLGSTFLTDAAHKGNVMVSPFRLLAYQKIFNDFYRNQDWSPADVRSFNIDDYADDSNLIIDKSVAQSFCQMRYRPYPKDWLTSMKPTPNYDKGIFNLPDYVNGVSRFKPERNSGSVGVSTVAPNTGSNMSFSVNDLRAAFALDKMLEATRRANGLDYSSQIEAHFGFKVPESRASDARFLGGFDNSIPISEVVATADTNNSNGKQLGDLAGKGLGSLNSGKISFDVKEHGIIMCIYSAAPQVEYNASYLDPFNKKFKREDFYQPEFADLGYQPVLSSDLLLTAVDPTKTPTVLDHKGSNIAPTAANELNNLLLGWQTRYNEYKTARDVVFGDFETSGSLRYWTTPRFDLRFDRYVSKKSDIPAGGYASGLSSAQFYVNPNIVNPIFLVTAVAGDHFYINSFFDVKAVRPMSVHGLASL
ncbi:hypothetical protein KZY67_05790 [Prevotella melaninogenica]|nr:major capsid protein [Prevotella melaninogenica]MBW4912156.1 hypothetical protein [Prevotella melaninogenica]